MANSVLLVNCYKDEKDSRLPLYQEWLAPHFQVKTVHLEVLKDINVSEDGIVLSGSSRMITEEPLPDTLNKLCLETTKPLLGICYGHQALATAWGAKIIKKKMLEGNETIRVDNSKGLLNIMGLFFEMYESHAEHIVFDGHLQKYFDVFARSDSCRVEVICHKEKPLWGIQFHPERSGVSSKQIAANFASIVASTKT